ncbi:MAG: amidohydrolase family protein [Acidimicrobiales bacterium]
MGQLTSAEIRAELDHPIVDADGHLVEVMPIFEEYLREIAGNVVADKYAAAQGWAREPAPHGWSDHSNDDRRRRRSTAPIWWANPTDALDRATAFVPALLYERLDEIGIDFTILYPSVGGMLRSWPDEDVRLGGCRALNAYLAEQTRPFADRMTVAAIIPAHTPAEAIAELDHAVSVLGAKVVVLPSYVERPIPEFVDDHPRLGREVEWLDVLALDSDYDYDPVWQRCVDLGVAVTTHSGSHGLGFRRSISTFMYNHIGHFSEAGDAFAKALFFGGVTRRFPTLNFAFLEQGVVRGVALYAALIERWNKRGGPNIEQYNPQRIDWARFDQLIARHGSPQLAGRAAYEFLHRPHDAHPPQLDDFARCAITKPQDIYDLFVPRFYFGCEADDRMNSLAFDETLNPFGAQLNAVLSSDLSHWDVPDMRSVLREAYELVEQSLVSPNQFRDFSADNCIRLHGQMNPQFFDGTVVQEYATKVLASHDE